MFWTLKQSVTKTSNWKGVPVDKSENLSMQKNALHKFSNQTELNVFLEGCMINVVQVLCIILLYQ